MSASMKRWKRACTSGSLDRLALFYETLLLQNIVGAEMPEDHRDGDILVVPHDACIDAKAAGNHQSFRLRLEQVDRAIDWAEFPRSQFWFALFSYVNRPSRTTSNGGGRGVLLMKSSQNGNRWGIENLLAENTNGLYLIPIELIAAFRKTMKAKKDLITRSGEESNGYALRLGRTFLRGLARDLSQLEEYGIDPADWSVIREEYNASVELSHPETGTVRQFSVGSFPVLAFLPPDGKPLSLVGVDES